MINALKWTLSSLLHMIKNVYKNCVHTKKLSASKNSSINKERIQYFTETRASRYFYQNYLDQVYFEVYMAYGSFRNSSGKAASGKKLRGEAFGTASNPNYDEYQRRFVWMTYKRFAKICK